MIDDLKTPTFPRVSLCYRQPSSTNMGLQIHEKRLKQ
ncbi:unnamed protein product [Brassica rapa subsp. trilocularis]